jgi:hypothetical protein
MTAPDITALVLGVLLLLFVSDWRLGVWQWPIWVWPLFFALGAMAFGVWVALGGPLWYFLERRDDTLLMGMAAVVTTGFAILTGLGELLEAFPRQRLDVVVITGQSPEANESYELEF